MYGKTIRTDYGCAICFLSRTATRIESSGYVGITGAWPYAKYAYPHLKDHLDWLSDRFPLSYEQVKKGLFKVTLFTNYNEGVFITQLMRANQDTPAISGKTIKIFEGTALEQHTAFSEGMHSIGMLISDKEVALYKEKAGDLTETDLLNIYKKLENTSPSYRISQAIYDYLFGNI